MATKSKKAAKALENKTIVRVDFPKDTAYQCGLCNEISSNAHAWAEHNSRCIAIRMSKGESEEKAEEYAVSSRAAAKKYADNYNASWKGKRSRYVMRKIDNWREKDKERRLPNLPETAHWFPFFSAGWSIANWPKVRLEALLDFCTNYPANFPCLNRKNWEKVVAAFEDDGNCVPGNAEESRLLAQALRPKLIAFQDVLVQSNGGKKLRFLPPADSAAPIVEFKSYSELQSRISEIIGSHLKSSEETEQQAKKRFQQEYAQKYPPPTVQAGDQNSGSSESDPLRVEPAEGGSEPEGHSSGEAGSICKRQSKRRRMAS